MDTSRVIENLLGRNAKGPAPQEIESTFDVIHPGTRKLVHRVQRSTKDDLIRAIDICYKVLPTWSTTSLQERCAIISRAADLLEDESSGWPARLIEANVAETSVTAAWSSTQVHHQSEFIRALVDAAPRALRSETVEEKTSTIEVTREPYGVCLALAPWNAAHILTCRAIVTPLLAGNTVVMKTSEHVPLTQTLWAELLYAAGLPREALCVVHVDAKDAAALVPVLVEDKRIRHVNFTGSTRVGSILAGLAGKNLKPSLMELGGKAPVLLLPDADIKVAASHILFGAFMNAGQLCMSTERIMVVQSRYNELVTALREAWRDVEQKIPRALFTQDSADRVRSLIDDATDGGAKRVLEEKDSSTQNGHTNDAFIAPTIIGPAGTNMRIFREESFGPVAVIITVPDAGRTEDEIVDEMVSLANEADYGLTGAVWSQDLRLARKVAARLECGGVHINAPANGDHPHVPHGGWKMSGWGRFNGKEGLRSFTQVRTVEIGKEPARPMPSPAFAL